MKQYLAEKIFIDLKKTYTFKEAKEKAILFIKSISDIEDFDSDYWIQIAKNWDLHVWWDDCTSCEAVLYPCEKGADGYFHDDTQNGINIFAKDFPVDEQKLKDFLEYFENQEYYATGVHYMSGGFATAEYTGYDEEEDYEEPRLYIELKWGVVNDVENRVNTENLSIPIWAFNEAKDNKEIYKLLSD